MPFTKAWDWQAAYCCSACGDTHSARQPRVRPPALSPGPGPGPCAHRVLGGHAVLHPPQPQLHHGGAGGASAGEDPRRSPAPSGAAAMAEPAGPFHLLRAGPGRFLCYCRPGPGPGGTV